SPFESNKPAEGSKALPGSPGGRRGPPSKAGLDPGADEAQHGHDRQGEDEVDADRRVGDRPLPGQHRRLVGREKQPGDSHQQEDDPAVAMKASSAQRPHSDDREDRGLGQGQDRGKHREERQSDRDQAPHGRPWTAHRRSRPLPSVVLPQPYEDGYAEDTDDNGEDEEPDE